MPNNYIYRIAHDTGFAPNTSGGICSLCGCKRTSIEKWAQKGSWVIGIGGNNTGVASRIIYAMEVEDNLTYSAFRLKYPRKSKYLIGRCNLSDNVLYSRNFYYFGHKAIPFPSHLNHSIICYSGCKKISTTDVTALTTYIGSLGFFHGVYGYPNNSIKQQCKKGINDIEPTVNSRCGFLQKVGCPGRLMGSVGS